MESSKTGEEKGRKNIKKETKRRANPTNRIIGGDIVALSDDRYPWFTLMMHDRNVHICGGMLVAPEYVLTAAHCVGYFNGVQIGPLCPFEEDNCGQVSEALFNCSINSFAS